MKCAVKLLSVLAVVCVASFALLSSAEAAVIEVPIYVESFEDYPDGDVPAGWIVPRVAPKDWAIAVGEFVHDTNNDEWAITSYADKLGDFSAEFDMANVPRAQWYGAFVGIRCSDLTALLRAGSGYGLQFRPVFGDVKLTKNGVGTLVTATGIGAGPYLVKIVALGANIKVYIDTNLIFDYTDATPVLVGYFGFESRQSTTNIDNITISGVTEVVGLAGPQGPAGSQGPPGDPATDTVRSDAEILAVVGPHTVKYTDAEAITAVLPQVGASLVAHSGDANVHHVPTVDTDTVRSDAEIIALMCAFKKGRDCPKDDDDDDDDDDDK